MKCSEITLGYAMRCIQQFCPIKIMFNDIVLYNDYDSTTEIEEGVYGEIEPYLCVVPDRIRGFEKSIVTSVEVEIVEFHHSIVVMRGEYRRN